jgi:hypothetical protein
MDKWLPQIKITKASIVGGDGSRANWPRIPELPGSLQT